jgi:glycerol-3-phosphate acyltransferase PlsY
LEFLSNTNIQLYLLAYVVGSIPFGFILAKVIGKVDIKKEGSGNIGATNVLRVLKERQSKLAKKLSISTLILDVSKGVLVLLIAKFMGASQEVLWGVAVFAVIGHCFSIFLLGEGGKGVATGLGVLLFMIPIPAIIGIVFWAISAKVLKISSMSSLLGLLALVVSSFLMYPDMAHSPIVIIAFIILYKHSDNIYRLISGEEARIEHSKSFI